MHPAPTLNPRRQNLLEIIVGDYIETATPVASQHILRRHDLQVSPATIRNDMAELEEMGYISRPHASAGGVPGDLAYRFYVGRQANTQRPSRQFEMRVHGALQAGSGDPESWVRDAATILSDSLLNVAIATAPRVVGARVKQLQLVHLQDSQALLVLVLQDARVRQQMVHLAYPTSQEELTSLANRLNTVVADKNADEIRTAWDASYIPDAGSDAVLGSILTLLANEEQTTQPRQYTEGLRHILSQPEFQDTGRAREAVEVLEDGDALRPMIIHAEQDEDVDVVIGEESRAATLRPYSVVLARYGLPGHVNGVIGTIGPTRMDYARTIASVRYLAIFLSDLLAVLADERR